MNVSKLKQRRLGGRGTGFRRTLGIGTIKLSDGGQRVVTALVVDECRALGASGTIVQKLELQDRPNLVEEALPVVSNQ